MNIWDIIEILESSDLTREAREGKKLDRKILTFNNNTNTNITVTVNSTDFNAVQVCIIPLVEDDSQNIVIHTGNRQLTTFHIGDITNFSVS